MSKSILDIENAILEILENTKSISRYIETLTLGEELRLTNNTDKEFLKELKNEIVAFKNNNTGTLISIKRFYKLNDELREDIRKELRK